jgi:threonine dehydrogenase-like Zn-dependent dehydrogenase
MYAAQWAKLKGASRIIGIDRVPERLAFAMNKLQIETVDFTEYKDVPECLYELVPGGIDVALDCGELGATQLVDDNADVETRHIPRAKIMVTQDPKDVDVGNRCSRDIE